MSEGDTRVDTSMAVEYQGAKRLASSLDFVEQSQSGRPDAAVLHASRPVCARDVKMLECRRLKGIDAFWSRSARRPHLARFHDAIRPSHRREMAFENPLKEACRMNSQTLPPPALSPDEAAVRALYQRMMEGASSKHVSVLSNNRRKVYEDRRRLAT
jgi:hypothetical protein